MFTKNSHHALDLAMSAEIQPRAATPPPQPAVGLADLFASPGPSRPPPAEPLFFSPGSNIDSPQPRRVSSNRRVASLPVRQPVFQVAPAELDNDGDDAHDARERRTPTRESDTRQVNGIHRGLTQPGGDFAATMDPFAALDAPDEDGTEKKRRVVAKVDADRLMGSDGLTALMVKAKKFKVRGKGREVSLGARRGGLSDAD